MINIVKFNVTGSLTLALSETSASVMNLTLSTMIPVEPDEGKLDFSTADNSGLMVLVL